MNFKTSLLLAALALAATAANAGGGAAPAPIDISSGAASFGSGPLPGAAAVGADEIFTFTGLNPALSSYDFEIEGGASGSITLDSVSLDGVALDGAVVGGKLFSFVSDPVFLAGGFTLDVRYDKLAGPASIGGSVTAVSDASPAAPAPEPGSLALMLAGLGMVGFVSARRGAASRPL